MVDAGAGGGDDAEGGELVEEVRVDAGAGGDERGANGVGVRGEEDGKGERGSVGLEEVEALR